MVHVRDGEVRARLGTVADPRTGPRWYLLAADVSFRYADAGHADVGGVAGRPVTLAPHDEVAVGVGVTLLLAWSLEEFGWRGFARLHLQERHDALVAAVVVGVAVGVWHYPWLLLAGAGYEEAGPGAPVALPLLMVLVAAVYAWLFNGSGGTVPVVRLGHAVFNASPVSELAGDGPGLGGSRGVASVGGPGGRTRRRLRPGVPRTGRPGPGGSGPG